MAEMKLPGRAWLEFEVTGNEQQSTIRQTAIFDPVGLAGLTYWYTLYPLHQLVFSGMLRNIAKAAAQSIHVETQQRDESHEPPTPLPFNDTDATTITDKPTPDKA